MRYFITFLATLCALAGLTGCAHTYANVSTQQDPKYSVLLKDKIAVAAPNDATAVDLASRLAGETIAEQLRVLGYNVASPAEADFLLSYTIATKDVPVTYGETMPTMSNTMGDVYGRPINGTTFGEVVIPRTRIVNMTELDATLQQLHDPKLQIWQGHIQAETADVQQYRAQFFRALLAHIGGTASGYSQLDGTPDPAAPPQKQN